MRDIIHRLLMKIIPWRCWSWSVTRRLMYYNYLANKKEFDLLTGASIFDFYRHVMDHIHQGGNIFNDKGRKRAYEIVALLASNTRQKG